MLWPQICFLWFFLVCPCSVFGWAVDCQKRSFPSLHPSPPRPNTQSLFSQDMQTVQQPGGRRERGPCGLFQCGSGWHPECPFGALDCHVTGCPHRVWEARFMMRHTSFAGETSNKGGTSPITWLNASLEGNFYQDQTLLVLEPKLSLTKSHPCLREKKQTRSQGAGGEADPCLHLSGILETPCLCTLNSFSSCQLHSCYTFNRLNQCMWLLDCSSVRISLITVFDWCPDLATCYRAAAHKTGASRGSSPGLSEQPGGLRRVRMPRPSCRDLEAPVFFQSYAGILTCNLI